MTAVDARRPSRHAPVHGLHARILGRVVLDAARLDVDLAAVRQLPLNAGYSEFSRGHPGWRNCVLANHNGDPSEHVFGGHDGRALPTPHLAEVPYIAELLASTFSPEHLLWARLFICEDGMLIPHRDYLDLPDEFTRVHLALRRGDRSLHSENEQVFRMREGEIWFIDGTVDHAAASYDGAPRTYLSCDFRAGVPFDELVIDADARGASTEPDFIERPPLPDNFTEQLDVFVQLIDETAIDDAVAVLSRTHLAHIAPCGAVYDWIADAADRAGRSTVASIARDRRAYFLGA